MALTYTWEITGIKTKNETNGDGIVLPNAICQTYWKCTGTDENGASATFMGATPFSAANVSESDFELFDNLTEELVLGWVKAYVDSLPHYMPHIEERIQKQIDEKSISAPLMPWKPAEEQEQPPVLPSEQA